MCRTVVTQDVHQKCLKLESDKFSGRLLPLIAPVDITGGKTSPYFNMAKFAHASILFQVRFCEIRRLDSSVARSIH
ncbi:MAG: hypothetical protein QOE55_2613 [Acidobacteriaceae bacterium]|nr:hypothetical protein [Acidobacteriaceae bacterium]